MDTIRILIAAWFVASALVSIVTNFGLFVWAIRKKIPIVVGLSGIPGYLDMHYVRWCRTMNRSARRMIWIRVSSIVSLLLSAAAFLLVVVPHVRGPAPR